MREVTAGWDATASGKSTSTASAIGGTILWLMMEVTVSDFVMFEEDDLIRVVPGPFASFIGVVEEGDEGRSGLKVGLQVLGRVTRVELEFGPVESKVWPTRRCADVN